LDWQICLAVESPPEVFANSETEEISNKQDDAKTLKRI